MASLPLKLIPKSVILLVKNLQEVGNPFALPREEAISWAEGLDIPKEGTRIFFASCMYPSIAYGEILLRLTGLLEDVEVNYNTFTSIAAGAIRLLEEAGIDYDLIMSKTLENVFALKPLEQIRSVLLERYTQSVRKAFMLMRKLGLECAYLGQDEPCCGAVYHTYGFQDEFERHAKKVYDFLVGKGVKELITPNPICALMFKAYYPSCVEGFNLKVKTVTEVIFERLTSKNIELKGKGVVVFHDPCALARSLRVVNEPRAILARVKGLTVREAVNSRYLTRCDGGGGVEAVDPKIAKRIAVERVKELARSGAKTIVTACPVCLMMLRLGVAQAKVGLDVVEIHEIVYDALESGTLEG